MQRGFYSAAVECVFDGVSFPSSSERNGYDVKGLSIVLQDVKCPFPVTWDLLCCHGDQVNPSSTRIARPFYSKGRILKRKPICKIVR